MDKSLPSATLRSVDPWTRGALAVLVVDAAGWAFFALEVRFAPILLVALFVLGVAVTGYFAPGTAAQLLLLAVLIGGAPLTLAAGDLGSPADVIYVGLPAVVAPFTAVLLLFAATKRRG